MKQELLKNAGYCALDYQAGSIRAFCGNSYIESLIFAPSYSIYMFFMARKVSLQGLPKAILSFFSTPSTLCF